MTCKDCIYYDVCSDFRRNICEIDQKRFEEYRVNSNGLCDNFKDKSRYIELPLKVGDIVYSIKDCIMYAKSLEVSRIEYTKNYGLDFGAYARNQTYWMFNISDIGKTVFFTREEAEKVLAERRNNGN